MSRLVRLVLLASLLMPLAAQPADSVPGQVDMDDLRAFADVWGYIKTHYVDEVDDRELLEAAVRGMVSELDERSSWLSPDELASLEEQATGRYGGLGVRITVQPDHLQVVAAMDGSPAERAGLVEGDRIVAIDDRRLDENNSSQATSWLRGTPGTAVALTVERDEQDGPLEIEVTREAIQSSSVAGAILPGDFAYVRVTGFQQSTASELDDMLEALAERLGGHPEAMILDLRQNPGGMLHASVAVSDRFLSEKLVVYTEGRNPTDDLELFSNPGEAFPGMALLVLVDSASASAAEIVAGALQDHGRALIAGVPTYGKGSVQTVWSLRNQGGLQLTTAYYHTASGRNIEADGVEPDMLIEPRSQPLRLNGDGALATIDAEALATSDPALDEALRLINNARRLFARQDERTGSE